MVYGRHPSRGYGPKTKWKSRNAGKMPGWGMKNIKGPTRSLRMVVKDAKGRELGETVIAIPEKKAEKVMQKLKSEGKNKITAETTLLPK